MAPLCQIETTLLRVSESREERHDGAVDAKAGIHPARRVAAVRSGRLYVVDACELMGVHRRQVFRLVRGLMQDGAPKTTLEAAGRPSNHPGPGLRQILFT